MPTTPYHIAVAGLGTVGAGVVNLLNTHADMIAARAGRPVRISAVYARDRGRKRDCDLSGLRWADDPLGWVADEGIDAVVELVGGSDGFAYDLVKAALSAGKDVVTANKALLAHHGAELATLAEGAGARLMYEASVAGGIPVIKALREGFAGNDISAVYGILNGTCNYILTEMRETGRDFADVLKDAQALGYAEADPAFDIEGIDSAHKLCLLSALAFGHKPDLAHLQVQGITAITAKDIEFARELGYRIKLLGMARRVDGHIVQNVAPCLVPAESQMGAVDGVYNAVWVEGDFVGTGLSVGRGAGAGPTASAVVADLIDLARGVPNDGHIPTFGVPATRLGEAAWLDDGALTRHFYMHLVALDQPGVLAAITAILRDHDISVEIMLQRGRDPGQPVSIVMITHEASQTRIDAALAQIIGLDAVSGTPSVLRIERF